MRFYYPHPSGGNEGERFHDERSRFFPSLFSYPNQPLPHQQLLLETPTSSFFQTQGGGGVARTAAKATTPAPRISGEQYKKTFHAAHHDEVQFFKVVGNIQNQLSVDDTDGRFAVGARRAY